MAPDSLKAELRTFPVCSSGFSLLPARFQPTHSTLPA